MKTYFEGEVILSFCVLICVKIVDGVNHTFTSSLSANCEVLDVYFWNRFPTFKDIESLKDIPEHNSKHIYMRWTERGLIKQGKKPVKTKRIPPPSSSSSHEQQNPEEMMDEESDQSEDSFDEDDIREYMEKSKPTADTAENELAGNGQYFICFDTVNSKVVGYYKQNFLKNCQKLILEVKQSGEQGMCFPVYEKM